MKENVKIEHKDLWSGSLHKNAMEKQTDQALNNGKSFTFLSQTI